MVVTGFVDTIENGIITGWAANPDEPELPVALDIMFGGIVLDRVLARDYRSDVRQAGYGLGFHGFAYQASPGVDVRWLAIRPTGTAMILPGSWCVRRLDGRVDTATEGIVSGWALDLDVISASLEVEMLIDGVPFARSVAKHRRLDVAEALGGCGLVGFTFVVAGAFIGSRVQIRETNSGLFLTEGEKVIQAKDLATVGSFDNLSKSIATGWAYDAAFPNTHAIVDFFVNNVLVGSSAAFAYREDVEANGFGNGKAGFRAVLNLNLQEGEATEVEARLRRTGRSLNNSPRKLELHSNHYRDDVTILRLHSSVR